ncbi:MAG TPA: PAS domain S-box protein [Polyangiaceae bacterium]|jgi:PAS domain S-box-containing protein|nr:PAS domain S-box protein [Polyangiaceae bacterium]
MQASHLAIPLQTLLDAVPDAMIIADREGAIVVVNTQAEKLFAYAPGELLGQRVEALMPERFRAGHPARRDSYRDQPRVRPMGASGSILYGRRKDGSEFPAEISLSPLETEAGTLTIAAIRDGTDRRKAEDNLRALLNAAPDAVVMVNRAGTITAINEQAEDLFGFAREELVGEPVSALIPERFHRDHPGHIQGYFESPRRRAMGAGTTLAARRKDGSEFPAEISLSPFDSPEGPIAITSIRDVSARIAAEAAQRHLAAIVSSSDDAVISKTLNGIILSWNPGATRIYGYAADEVIGKSITLLAPPDRVDEIPRLLGRIREGQSLDHFHTVRRRKDGKDIHVSLTLSPLRDQTGAIIGASNITRDISAEKRAEEELTKAKAAADSANRELEAFSYSVAHDLRAPLRAISGFSEILQREYKELLDAQGQNYLRRMAAAAERMGHLIDALLSLSRVTRTEPRRERVDLGKLAAGIVEGLRATQPDRTMEAVIREGLVVSGDSQLLRAALENLLGNAWKFTGKREAARIELGMKEQDGEPVYFVADNGAGFEMEYASKLFAPFQRLHSPSAFPGTGIGLATVQRIVHRHGGRIWAHGEAGKGATFFFTLPNDGSNEEGGRGE